MGYLIAVVLSLVVGSALVFLLLFEKFRRVAERERMAEAGQVRALGILNDVRIKEADLRTSRTIQDGELERAKLAIQAEAMANEAKQAEREADLAQDREEFARRIISYNDVRNENAILKRDLLNIDVASHKLRLDSELLAQTRPRQIFYEERVPRM